MLEAEFAGDSVPAHVGTSGEERQIVLLGERGDETLVGVGFGGPKQVVEVRNEENDSQLCA